MEHLVELVQQLSLARDIGKIPTIACEAARRLTGADGATLILRDGEECVCAEEDAIGPLWKGRRFPVDTGISSWVIVHRQPAVIPDILEDARIAMEDYRSTFVRSLAMVPIHIENPIGAIGIYWAAPHAATGEEVKLLQLLADCTWVPMEQIRARQELEERILQHTQALESAREGLRSETLLRKQMEARVKHLSLTDEFTGLANRRGFLVRAEQMRKLVNRVHSHGWLIYIGIDGVSQVKDQMGSEAGDQLVRNAAKVLRECFRDSDIVARIGSDEFIVFAAGDSTPAVEIGERLAANIEYFNQCYPAQPALALSVGAIRCDPHSAHTLEEMIYQADAAMYIERRRKRARLQDELIE
jgi:diguanylate cyclase (GGDEF)-like protein